MIWTIKCCSCTRLKTSSFDTCAVQLIFYILCQIHISKACIHLTSSFLKSMLLSHIELHSILVLSSSFSSSPLRWFLVVILLFSWKLPCHCYSYITKNLKRGKGSESIQCHTYGEHDINILSNLRSDMTSLWKFMPTMSSSLIKWLLVLHPTNIPRSLDHCN